VHRRGSAGLLRAAVSAAAGLSALILNGSLDAQESARVDAAASAPMEELVVIGESRTALLRQIQIARELVFERWNEINSSDDFDIHCRDEKRLESRITDRVCRPNLRVSADAQSAQAFLANLQGAPGQEAWTVQQEAMIRQREMADEMLRMSLADDDLRRAAARLAELESSMNDQAGQRQNSGTTTATIATSAEQPLPYDAQVMAEVRMGRKAWDHALTSQTFAIAHLDGEIDSIFVRCGKERARFEYEPDAEWTLPKGWDRCTVTIRAPRETVFTLFEFE
jgi:hypothetical protein